jgi:hypothetical protein
MAWTTARTWVTGEVVTAAVMNTHVRDNLNALAVTPPPAAKFVGTAGGFGESWHPNLIPVGTNSTTQSVTTTTNQIYAAPLMVPRGTIDRISFNVTGSGGANNARQGIYEAVSANDPYPGSLVVDSGDISVNTTGLKTTTVSVVIEPTKMYWIVFQTSAGAPNVTAWLGGGFISPWGALAGGVNWQSFNYQFVGFKMTRSYAALPSTFPALSSPTWENPLMHGVRYSA